MTQRFIGSTLLAITLLLSSGCSWLFGDEGTFRDRSDDYRNAKVEPPLQVPDKLDAEAIDDSFAIPPVSDRLSLSAEFIVPRPQPLESEVDRDTVRINTLGSQQWILVNGAPGQVWPRLRGFLSLNELAVKRADAISGIIETAWLKPAAEDVQQERYRLRIEQGVQRGTSEVYVLQVDIAEGADAWPAQSSNIEREKLMTRSLAQYLADSAAAAAVSMLAQQAIDSSGKVVLEEDVNAIPYIKLSLPYSRAWAAVGKALNEAGFDVDDLNRSDELYYVHYLDTGEDEEPGFFSRMFSRDSDEDTDRGIAYLVKVTKQDGNTVRITIETQTGDSLDALETKKLLVLLKKHIS